MRRLFYIATVLLTALLITGCKQNKPVNQIAEVDSTAAAPTIADSTVYGVCGEGTSMHALELITDAGDTLTYMVNTDEEENVKGGLLAGDRLAVVGTEVDGEKVARNVINLTTLLGKWTSIDKNFEIEEGGVVKSNVRAESNPWTNWKILNGKLLLNKDTFTINELGADSLYLENKNGIFAYNRQK